MDLKTGLVPDISEAYGGTLRLEPAPHLRKRAVAVASVAADDIPASFTLVGLLSTAEDQARRGTCATFAAMVPAQYLRQKDLSEQHTYNIAWQLDNPLPDQDEGTSLEAVLTALTQGVCEEAVWPYVPEPAPGNIPQGPVPAHVLAAPKYGITQWIPLQLPSHGCAELLAGRLVASKTPIIVAVPTFWGGICGWEDGFFIDVPPGDPHRGGWHAIAIVGYNLSARFAIIQNSWGYDWGIAGMGLMSFDYLNRYVRSAFEIQR